MGEELKYVGKKVTIETYAGKVFNGIVKNIDEKDKKIVLKQVQDCSSGDYLRKDAHFFGDQIKDLKIHSTTFEESVISEVSDLPEYNDNTSSVKNNGQEAKPIVLDTSDAGTDLLQRRLIDPTSYLSGYDESFQSLSLHKPPNGFIIDTYGKIYNDAIQNIKSQKVVSFHCEGWQINRFGEISIIILGTRETVYLFDIYKLGKKCFVTGLKEILENRNILKVAHDIRLVSDCLNAVYKVRPVNIFDTQVADAVIYKQSNGNYPKEVSNLGNCVHKYLHIPIDQCDFEREKLKISQNNDIYTERPLDVKYRNCCAKLGMYLRELRTAMLQKMIAEFLCGVDIYLDCVRDMSNNAVKLFNPQRVPKEFSKISCYKANSRRNEQQRNNRLKFENNDYFDSSGDERTKIRSQWDSGRDYAEERQERHGEIVECLDGQAPLFDTSKPLLNKKLNNKEKLNTNHTNDEKKFSKNHVDTQLKNGRYNKKQSTDSSPNTYASSGDDMFANMKPCVDNSKQFLNELSLDQQSDHGQNLIRDDFQMSTSDSDNSDIFVTSVNDNRGMKTTNKRITTDRPKISPAGRRMITNNLRVYNNDEGSSSTLSMDEFPSLSKHVPTTEKKRPSSFVSPPPGLKKPQSPPGFQKPEASTNKTHLTGGGRGRLLQMLATTSPTKPVGKIATDVPSSIFGDKAHYDFPSDDELLQTPDVAPMHHYGPLTGEKVNVVKKYR